ncbi:MAG: type II secretion system protein [Candidatus Paceibacterota bacterium]
MKKQKGFVLIEIVFYAALIGFLSYAIFSTLNIAKRERINAVAFSEVNYQGIMISNLISKKIKEADNVVIEGNDKLLIYPYKNSKPISLSFLNGGIEVNDGDKSEKINNQKVSISSFSIKDKSVVENQNSISFSFTVSYGNESAYKYSKKFYGSANTK